MQHYLWCLQGYPCSSRVYFSRNACAEGLSVPLMMGTVSPLQGPLFRGVYSPNVWHCSPLTRQRSTPSLNPSRP